MPSVQEIKRRLQEKPYHMAILRLREIDKIEEPRKKLRLMTEVNELILSWVDEFWKNLDIDEEQLVIATDQMVLIYLYIVTRAKIVDLFAHFKYITAFTTQYVRQSNLGFLLATYEHALYTLMEHDQKGLRNLKGSGVPRIIDLNRQQHRPVRDTFADLSITRESIMPDGFLHSGDDFAEIDDTEG